MMGKQPMMGGHTSAMLSRLIDYHYSTAQFHILYSGYSSWGKIFVSSEFLASSWKYFHGHGILNHTWYYAILFRG